jgi:protein-tyrosine phosphatase
MVWVWQANYPPHFAYLAFDALDQPEYDLLGQHFDAFSQFLEEARRANRVVRKLASRLRNSTSSFITGQVFVHCQAGVNRSATLCVAYLMLLQQVSLVQAVEHCARLRPCILRNEGFIEQLVVFASTHDCLG